MKSCAFFLPRPLQVYPHDFLTDLWVVDLFEQICASTQVSVPNPVSRDNSFFIVIWY
jgi:hypothetical protein